MSKTDIEPKDFLDETIDETWYKDKDYHTMYIAKITKILTKIRQIRHKNGKISRNKDRYVKCLIFGVKGFIFVVYYLFKD